MEGVVAFGTALVLVALLELGDKTQLATISLASRHPWAPVFAGATLGLIAATAIGVLAGAALATVLASWLVWVRVAGGALFIALGLWSLRRAEEEVGEEKVSGRGVLARSFILNFLAEMGDKTQIAVFILAASLAAPLSVFAGASLGLALVTAVGVAIGTVLAKHLSAKRVRLLSAALFIIAGTLLIAEALLGL